jgi:segregation and condensation protein B
VDQDTQQFDGNNPQSETTPEVGPDTGQETAAQVAAAAAAAESAAASAPPEPASSMSADERKAALEAIIYAADEPATIEQLAKALDEPKVAVQAALDELVASYASESRGIEIRGVAGGYKMYTKPQHHDLVRRFIKSLRPPLRLTMPALETLAVISYKQPVTAPEIQEIRGVNTSGVIKTLLDKKLITTAGRKEVIGRPILYRTSKEFLMRFGLSDLGELPSLKEFEALAREALGTDEGVAESDAGDESVLDSIEPTEADAVAELEASASEDAVQGGESLPMVDEAAASTPASDEEPSAPKQFEQSISADVAEAIAAQPVESAATPENKPKVADVVAEAHEAVAAHEPSESEPQHSHAVAEPTELASSAAEPTNAVAEAPKSFDSPEAGAEQQHVEAVSAESHAEQPSTEHSSQESENISAHGESAEAVFAESEPPAHAAGIGTEPHEKQVAAMEYESSIDADATAHEISDEILAQLTQGIEIEVSADSLAALSSEIPAEEAPAQFYSSNAEHNRDLLPNAQPAETVTEQSSEEATKESESTGEREKSRKAAAGE